ncbi:hypothetical protein N482_10530 [Pseudoalteromonas luteoviolacea NCIMB 1942]|uniref:Uncharacterized protein n=1 Tax=Pseudoalteromonas luteoviolacea NCIMB 1942 TaxID=1365253 RepID=A0A167C7Y4_9GAMM|nr:hypothetical protein N482_10530 [Pseudoalteromonas luteoviolacea NCIMB 1942]
MLTLMKIYILIFQKFIAGFIQAAFVNKSTMSLEVIFLTLALPFQETSALV